MKKGEIIAVVNHKGGVGKTAAVVNIGAILASQGRKVLVVDLDTQANLTMSFLEDIPTRIIYHAIRDRKDLPIVNIRKNLDLVPSGLDMAGIVSEMTMMKRREYIIKDLLEPYKNRYDYIFLDCPPNLELITLNALTAASKMLVPMKADLMSDYGLSMLDKFCADMQDLNPGVHINSIFFSIYEKTTVSDAIEADVRGKYGDRVLATVVRKNVDVSKAAFEYTDVVSYDASTNGAKDFQALAKELVEKL